MREREDECGVAAADDLEDDNDVRADVGFGVRARRVPAR
jgi:hypothetical protein